MTQSGLSDFSSPGSAGDGTPDSAEAEREDLAAQEAAVVAGGGRGRVSDVVDVDEAKFPESTGTVELMITQIDYAVEGYGNDEYPIVHVFGRRPVEGDDDAVEHIRVIGVEPYFYVPTADLDRSPVEEYDVVIGTREETVAGEPYESIRGEPLTRIVTRTPRDVGNIRDDFETSFEADILFPNRFLIDNGINGGLRVEERRLDDGEGTIQVHEGMLEPADVDAEMRVNTFDIEVDDRRGFPEDGEEPIICLTSHDSYDDEYVVWLYDAPEAEVPPPEDLPNYEGIVGDSEELDFEVRTFEKEAAMLDAFVEYIGETDVDLMTGWNFEDFDAPYLLDRMEVLDEGSQYDLSVDRLSRIGEVWRSGWGGPDVKGRVVFDLLYAYKRTMFTELESYRLDAVGERELGVGKERYTGDIGDLWEQDPERLLEYSIRDVELCVEIDRKQDVIAFWDEVRTFVGCKIEDAPTPGDTVDMYVLHKAFGKFALPTKGQQESEEFEGGAVFDPITGVKEMVTVQDLKCFSADTDVATPNGLKSITELNVGDPVYTLNSETFECEIKPVAETHSYQNKYGELHHVSGNTHDFKVTENHRFLLSQSRGWSDLGPSDFEFSEYRDVPEYERFAFPMHEPMAGSRREKFDLFEEVEDGHVAVYAHDGLTGFRAVMPVGMESELDRAKGTSRLAAVDKKAGKYLIPIEVYRQNREQIEKHADETFLKYDRGHAEMPLSFKMDDWLELMGWFVTEGNFVREVPGIVLHQRDPQGRESIRDLLERMDLNYASNETRFKISNQFLHDWFLDHCGDGFSEKQLPEWVFGLDASHLRHLLNTLIDGDGSRTESGLNKFWTKSDRLKQDAVRLGVRCGEKPTVTKQSDGTWYVSIGKEGSLKKANATTEPHDGQVHCITAQDNHTVLAGRNGHLQWIGQSLYPMCMVTINAGPETKVDPDEYDGETYVAPSGTHFRKEPDGIMREMVDELLSEREQKKGLRNDHEPGTEPYEQYNRQQASVKVIMNSLYGVTGWDRFRLYDKEGAAAVTATGREVIDFTEEAANELNYQVAYGDTDSVMISLSDMSKEEAIETSFEIEDHINERYDDFARDELNADVHRFQIEFEKLYRRFFQAGKKKRYAGHIIWKEGKDVDDIDITGFEYKRSDIAQITKEVQQNVIETIVTGDKIDEDMGEVKSYLVDVIARVLDGEMDLDEIGIPGGIGKKLDAYDTPTAQVRGAKYANLMLETNFGSGSKPKRLYIEKVHPDFWQRMEEEEGLDPQRDGLYGEFKRDPDVICFEYADQVPEEFEVDWEKMLEKTLKGPIERVIEALGMSWEEVKTGQEQTGLGSFM